MTCFFFMLLGFGVVSYCWKPFPVFDSQIHSHTMWSHCTLRELDPQRIHSLDAKTRSQSKHFHSGYQGGHFSQVWGSTVKSMIYPKPSLSGGSRYRKSRIRSVLRPSMKQQLEWWLGTWRDFHGVGGGKLLVLMGRWWRWVGCCNPGGQGSQLSQYPKPCQLDAAGPLEATGTAGTRARETPEQISW